MYVYYQLDNFYQNHRRYVKSRDYQQLMGEVRTLQQIQTAQTCDPVYTNADVNVTRSFNGTLLDPNAVAIPCGLIAKSVFTDSYTLTTSTTPVKQIDINSDNIAWKSDVSYKFKNSPCPSGQTGDCWQATQWLNMTNCKFN